MELIVELTDVSLGLVPQPGPGYAIREASRGVIIKDGKIALVHLVKNRSYKLPGGGREPSDTDSESTFAREVLEETGWEIGPATLIGRTLEIKDDPEFRVMQLSDVYISEALRDTHRLKLDPEEIFFDYETE